MKVSNIAMEVSQAVEVSIMHVLLTEMHASYIPIMIYFDLVSQMRNNIIIAMLMLNTVPRYSVLIL